MIIFPKTLEENGQLKAWIVQRVKDYRFSESTQCIAVIRSEQIAAVVAWDNYRGKDIEVSFASDNPHWATKQTIKVLLAYPFLQLGCQRVTAFVHKSNKRCRRFIRGIGFEEEGKHRHAGSNLETMFSYGMTKMDYLERYDVGEKESARTTAAA